jgi:hypothetical protein
MEVALEPFNRFRRAVQIRNRAAAEFRGFQSLSDRDLTGRIWAGWQKEPQEVN